jgi:carbon storage regulator
MVVLSRKMGQRIVLPETGVSIAVLGINGKCVRIGIEAPQSISVHRQEIWERILSLTEPSPIDKSMRESPAA